MTTSFRLFLLAALLAPAAPGAVRAESIDLAAVPAVETTGTATFVQTIRRRLDAPPGAFYGGAPAEANPPRAKAAAVEIHLGPRPRSGDRQRVRSVARGAPDPATEGFEPANGRLDPAAEGAGAALLSQVLVELCRGLPVEATAPTLPPGF